MFCILIDTSLRPRSCFKLKFNAEPLTFITRKCLKFQLLGGKKSKLGDMAATRLHSDCAERLHADLDHRLPYSRITLPTEEDLLQQIRSFQDLLKHDVITQTSENEEEDSAMIEMEEVAEPAEVQMDTD